MSVAFLEKICDLGGRRPPDLLECSHCQKCNAGAYCPDDHVIWVVKCSSALFLLMTFPKISIKIWKIRKSEFDSYLFFHHK